MKKHKVVYKLSVFGNRKGSKIVAKREIPFEIKLAAKLILDDLCFSWNKTHLETKINESIDKMDKEGFMILSKQYQPYTWE
ncbi:hypothetical protein [Radiobacillus sp. PE A8.2]|uniref:hypothetical protein n=1 Tax=Radiobacillus sp. PE A8.2 TaxID=3380349 RepID=UPI00388DED40